MLVEFKVVVLGWFARISLDVVVFIVHDLEAITTIVVGCDVDGLEKKKSKKKLHICLGRCVRNGWISLWL